MNNKVVLKDFPKYCIDINGEIYTSYNKKGKKKLKKFLTSKGYFHVILYEKKKRFCRQVHRLVAETFIPNPEHKPEVNHINGIRNDNRVENLEWATRSENELHKYRVLKTPHPKPLLGKFGKDSPKHKRIRQIKNSKIIAVFYGSNEAERKTGISFGNICACCRHERKSAGGYQWEFDE